MGKSIKISLLPSKKDKIYRPQPGFSDLYILMNKLHFHSIPETPEEERPTLGKLELQAIKIQEEINKFYQQESTLNVLSNCLENVDRQLKKLKLSKQIPNIEFSQLEDFNKIIDESEIKIKETLSKIIFDRDNLNTENLIYQIDENFKLLKEHKVLINDQVNNLNEYLNRIKTLKENINASTTDVDSLEIALKSLETSWINNI